MYAIDSLLTRPERIFEAGILNSLHFELLNPKYGVLTTLIVRVTLSNRNPMPENASVFLSCPFGIDFSSSSSDSGITLLNNSLRDLAVSNRQNLSVGFNRTHHSQIPRGTSFFFELQKVLVISILHFSVNSLILLLFV